MDTRGGFSIRVVNDGMGSRIAWLQRHVDQLKSGSSIDAYRKAVRKLLETGERGNAAGLGLLRVRHEANAEIEIHVQGRRVSVTAIGQAGFEANQAGAGLPGRRRDS
jgi:hypothetical protein